MDFTKPPPSANDGGFFSPGLVGHSPSSSSSSGGTAKNYEADEYFGKAEQYIGAGQTPLAVEFLKRGLQLRPNDLDMLKLCGESLMDMNQTEEAKQMFLRCKDIDPNDAGVWMYLGQIASNKEAQEYFENGIKVLHAELDKAVQKNEEDFALRQELCCGYCSLAELYMSDLCFEQDAEQRCEDYLAKANTVCPDNPQALQTMASLRISQCRPQDAKPLILKAAGVIEQLMDMLSLNTDEEQDGDSNMMDTDQLLEALPPFEFRAATCRILVEVDEIDRAMPLLEKLIEENDEIAEVWLLLGQCHAVKSATDAESRKYAMECFEKSKEVCDKLLQFDPTLANDENFKAVLDKLNEFLSV